MSTEIQQAIAAVTANPLADPTNFANSVTAIYGHTGSGKSSLADTAIEHCYELFGMISLVYAADLGGYGSKRLALIRKGIAIVWDPRNHVDPFATMQMLSLGAFPAYLLPGGGATRSEREKGYAPPDAELVLPHRKRYTVAGADGTRVYQGYSIPEAQTAVAQAPGSVIVTEVVRDRRFAKVGHRVYDSMTALNDWGLMDLADQSARGLLPVGAKGGSALGSADALVSGLFRFGTSSEAQFGFVQNRCYEWIANARTIPDSVLPATMTFLVEESKGDKESGGAIIYGPKIAGRARTSAVGGWVGNLCYACHELSDTGAMVRRLWLVNHVDARDPLNRPYVAKHRGTPLGMPNVLEDDPTQEPWTTCSLGVLYRLLDAQVTKVDEALALKFPNAPGLPMEALGEDEVVRTVSAPVGAGATPLALLRPVAAVAPIPGAQPAASIPGRRRAVGALPALPAPAIGAPSQPAPPAAQVAAAVPVGTAGAHVPAPLPQAPSVVVPAGPVVQTVAAIAMPPAGAPLQPAQPQLTTAPRGVATRSRSPRPPV